MLVLCGQVARAADEKLPSDKEIKKAIERGSEIRKQTALVPGALIKSALIVKCGAGRCGYATGNIEDAKGEAGAAYRLVEHSKSALAGEDGGVIVDYTGTYLLGADLGLLSGKLEWNEEVANRKENKQQTRVSTTELRIKDDKLSWEFRAGKDKPLSESMLLYGARPVPQNALPALAALAPAGTDGSGGKLNLCVPEFFPHMEFESDDVQPAWLVLESNAQTRQTRVSIHHVAGDLTKKGLELRGEILPPPSEIWSYAESLRMLSPHGAGDAVITVEIADPATLDKSVPLDLKQIWEAMKGKMEK